MSVEDIKAVVRREVEAFNADKLETFDEIISPDYVGHDPAQPEPIRGPKGAKEQMGGYRAAFPDVILTIDQQVAEGDTVVTRWTARGTHEGELMGIAPTGKQVTVTGVTIERVVDGKIVEGNDQWDALGLLQQLGAVSMPAQV